MRISFVLPKFSRNPIGGFRIAYEYAERLAARGHEVTVVHVVPGLEFEGARRWTSHRAWRIRAHALRGRGRPPWYPLDGAVRTVAIGGRTADDLPDGDVVVATAFWTAELVARAPDRCGRGAYLIQHLETWSGDSAGRVEATWRLPLHRIVIARWLEDHAAELGVADGTTYVPNGVDFGAFPLDRPIEARDPLHVGLLVHPIAWKGTSVGLDALARVREAVPDLRVSAFGTYGAGDLPDWVDFRGRLAGPDLAAFYNALGAYVHPSHSEGWGLPAAEAMACGAALATTDNPGVLDFAVPDQTALVSPRGDADALAASILRLIREPDLRIRLATRAATDVRAFTWDRAVDGFERAIAD